MSKAFELVSDYQPSGDQPEAIRQLLEGIDAGLAHQTLLGVTGSGKTFTLANVIAQAQRPTILLAPNKTLAAQLYGEMKGFFPNNAVEYFVFATIITSQRRMYRRPIPLLRRMPRSTHTLNRCVCRQPKRFLSVKMPSLWLRCRRFMVWAIRTPT